MVEKSTWVRLRTTAVALFSTFALAACATLPTSGDVHASNPNVRPAGQVSLTAAGPVAGAEPEHIVRDFLRACGAGFFDDFAVARLFLGGNAVSTWQPEVQVRVFPSDASLKIERTAHGGVEVQVGADASLDKRGNLIQAGPGATVNATFTLAKNGDGQWRIAELEDGVVISQAAFSSAFLRAPLYFLTPDRQTLVPDTRWYPRRRLTTYLVQGLLEGPSPWLAQAVFTAFPAGTYLPATSVQVKGGVLKLDLSNEVGLASAAERSLMLAQLNATLATLPSVSQVEVTMHGSPIDLGEPARLSRASQADSALVVQGGTILRQSKTDREVLVPAATLTGFDVRHPAANAAVWPLVFLDGTQRLVVMANAGARPLVLRTGTKLLPPSVDRTGWIWTADEQYTGHLLLTRADGSALEFDVPWLHDGTLVQIQVDSTGTQLVVLRDLAGQRVLDVAAVKRSAAGLPIGLGEPQRLPTPLASITSVAWAGSATVLALGAVAPDKAPTLYSLGVGLPLRPIPTVANAQVVVGGTDDSYVMVQDSSGDLYVRSGITWRHLVSGILDPSFAG